MKREPVFPDYADYDAIVERARVQRSIAVGDGIARMAAAIAAGLNRALGAVKRGLTREEIPANAVGGSGLDAVVHH
jgi:phosphoglycolate phosphatase-like HAD superfamily hydrolase